jgi:hypothetical protein
MIRMNHIVKIGFVAALFLPLSDAARADDFKLSNNQRISCSRGLSAGKLNTATCKSYAYVFNTKTSEYFRCQVTLALTRDNKEVIRRLFDLGQRQRQAEGAWLHHHQVGAWVGHLEMSRHDISVTLIDG